MVRLGKKDPQKTRLLKVDVPSEKLKKLALRNSSKLHEDSNPAWVKKVFITPDLTPKEQAENKILREKLAELNKKVPRSYRIKKRSNCQEGGVLPHLNKNSYTCNFNKDDFLVVIQVIFNLLR